MPPTRFIAILVLPVLLAACAGQGSQRSSVSSSSSSFSPSSRSSSSAALASITDGRIRIVYDSDRFGLATNAQQILKSSYIPPCEEGFRYCFYFNGTEYDGTNFDSAGLSVRRRTDLTSDGACLRSLPAGYSSLSPTISEQPSYSTSMFSPLDNAGAGHVSRGTLYRLFVSGTCYEFETRIGQSQFANYEPGTIEPFTEDDRAALDGALRGMLEAVTFTNGQAVIFPPAPSSSSP